MSLNCPNKNLESWKDLVKIHGEDISHFLWSEFDGLVPKEFYSESVNLQIPKEEIDKIKYKDAIPNAKFPLAKPFKNRPGYSKSKLASNAKSLITKDEYGNEYYPEDYPKGSNKRHIANRFFRYSKYKNGTISEPYYPYRVDEKNWNLGKKYIDYINSLYDRNVVGIDNVGANFGVITFLPQVEEVEYIGGDEIDSADMPFEDEYVIDPRLEAEMEAKTIDVGKDTKRIASIDKVIEGISERVKLLETRAKKTGSSKIKANITELNRQLDRLREEKTSLATPNLLEKIAEEDSKVIEANLQSIQENVDNLDGLSEDQILSLIENLKLNSHNIRGWIDIQAFVNHEGKKDLIENLDRISGIYERLHNKYTELSKELFTEYSNRFIGSKTSVEELSGAVKDISLFKAGVFSLKDSGIKILKIVGDVFDKTSDTINDLSIKKKAEVKKWSKKLKDAGFSQNEVIEIFKQKHNGKWSGNLIGETRHEYYLKRSEAFEKSRTKNNKNIYKDFLKENSISLNSKLLQEVESGNYDNALKLGFNKQELDVQKQLLKEYQEDKNAYKEFLEFKYGDNQQAINDELNAWLLSNAPYDAFGRVDSGGYKYLIKEKPDPKKWADKDFDKIKNNKVLMDFYKFIRERFDENNKNLGLFNEVGENYLPELKKTFYEEIKDNPMSLLSIRKLGNGLKNAISDELESDYKELNIFGETIKEVPITMMWGRVPPSLKDGNIFRILDEHTEMSLAHKYKSEIAPAVNIATDILNDTDELMTGGKEVKNKLAKAKELLNYSADAQLYGKRKDVEGRIIKVKTKEVVLNKKTGEEEVKEVEREVTGSSMADTLISYTYMKAMSFPNLVTPAVNMVFGINANLIYASAGQDVDLKTIRKAMNQMLVVTAKSFGANNNSELTEKVFAFMQRFKLLGVIHDNEYGSNKTLAQKITILQEKAEYFNQGSLMLGILQYNKLKTRDGKEVSIFDAYKVEDGVLVWNEELMGEEIEVLPNRVIQTHRRGVNLNRLGKHIDRVNATVHGDYKSDMMAKKYAALRVLMLFKTWLPMAINHRFGKQDFDETLMNPDGTLGRTVKGRYRSFIRPVTKDGHTMLFGETMKMLLKGIVSKKSFNELSEVDRVNLIRNIKEIKQIIIFYTAALMLKGLFEDEDDELKPILNLAINTLTKTSADLSFFVSPNSASQVLDNLVPVASSLRDLERIIDSSFGLITGDIVYESGPYRGKPKIAINTLRAIPGSSSAIKMWNLGSKVIEY